MSIRIDAPAPVGAPRRKGWLLSTVAPLLSLFVVQPWTVSAFPVWDYAEMLPILRTSHGFADAVRALAAFYRSDGRANYLTYGQLAATWRVAGDNPVWWQWQRALLMLGAAFLLIAVARRLGATPLAAAIGATLFMLAVPSTEGWLFIMGEPLAVVFLLLLMLAAAGYSTAPAWRMRAVVIALLAAAVMLSKEVLGVCLPPIAVFALCWVPGKGFCRPTLGPRERWLILLLVLVVFLEAGSVYAALRDAVPQSYSSAFGREPPTLARWFNLFQSMLLPARFASSNAATTLYPANLAFILLLLLATARPRGQSAPRGSGWWVAGFVAFPVIGALTYVMWPRYSAFYGIPFFAGSVGLLVLAASNLERACKAGRWIVCGLGLTIILYTAIVSARTIGDKRATADLAARIVRTFPRAPRLDTLFVVAPERGGRRWPVTGSELHRYALAILIPETALPVIQDASCERVAVRLGRPLGNNGVLNDRNPCGPLPIRTVVWDIVVTYRDWLTLGHLADTARVEILAPTWARIRP